MPFTKKQKLTPELISGKKRRNTTFIRSKNTPRKQGYSRELSPYEEEQIGNIEGAALKAARKQKHAKYKRISGIEVYMQDGSQVEELDMTEYNMSHILRWRNNQKARNPSFAQLRSFLRHNFFMCDGRYKPREFMCGDFSEAIHNTAEASGVRCAAVFIQYQSTGSHALNLFETTDHGWVFVDGTAGLLLSKRNFFAQGKSFSQDSVSMLAYEGDYDIREFLGKYFADKIVAMSIGW